MLSPRLSCLHSCPAILSTLALILLAACADDPQPEQALAVATPTAGTAVPATVVRTATAPSPTPGLTATPTPAPTSRPVAGPTFFVNNQVIGCHEQPDTSAGIVLSRPAGSVQAMDTVLERTGETWHREVDRQCWVRTTPGPLRSFMQAEQAETYALTIRPPIGAMVATPLGSFTIMAVRDGEGFPPGCGPGALPCRGPRAGTRYITVTFTGQVPSGQTEGFEGLCFSGRMYLTSASHGRVPCEVAATSTSFSSGRATLQAHTGFAAPAGATGFTLTLPESAPIDLGR